MADIIFRSQFTSPPKTDIFGVITPTNRSCKIFLVRNLHTFTLYNVLQFCLSFLRSLSLYFLANLMVFLSLENGKFTEISSLYSPPWLTRFPVAKMSKLERGRNKNMDIIIEFPLAHGHLPLLYSEN